MNTTRVAAIYDVHGNLPALETVVAEIRSEGVDAVVVGGDVVPGPMPHDTLSLLRDLSIPVHAIQGNGEHDVLAAHRGGDIARVPARFHGTMRWVAGELEAEDVSWLAAWPRTVTLDVAGLGRVLFCHATPRDDNEIFTRLTPEDRLRPIFERTGADLVVCGHTHMQFDRTIGSVRVVNAGSVGMPFGDPGAYWLLLGPAVERRCTSYDLAAAVERVRATEYPGTAEFDLRHPASEQQMLDLFEAAALR